MRYPGGQDKGKFGYRVTRDVKQGNTGVVKKNSQYGQSIVFKIPLKVKNFRREWSESGCGWCGKCTRGNCFEESISTEVEEKEMKEEGQKTNFNG